MCHLNKKRHPKGCIESMIGDGICEDECNNLDFVFDDGDCCLSEIDDLFCEDCICLADLPPERHPSSKTDWNWLEFS